MQARQYQAVLNEVNKFIEQEKLAHAIALLNQTLKQSPHFYEGWLKLSQCLAQARYFKQARDIAHHAEQFDPLTQDFQSIQHFMQQQALQDAAMAAKQMLAKCLHHPRAVFTLAHIALAQQQPDKSVALLEQEVPHLPANDTLRQILIDSYEQAGEFAKAIESAQKFVEVNECFESFWKLIGLLLKYGRYDALLETCTKASSFTQHDLQKKSQLELIRGQALRIKGEREASINALKVSLSANPKNADSWWALADMKNYVFTDDETQQIKSLVDNQGLPSNTRAIATFALAKALEVNSGIEQSLPLYIEANQGLGSSKFNANQMAQEFESRIKTYTKNTLALQATQSQSQPRPIFIVGMPRSGSTLVEQILTSHPMIEGTLEQPTLPNIESRAQRICIQNYQTDLHNGLSKLSTEELTQLGLAYLDSGHLFRRENLANFTDKQPFNYRLIGLIHKILPNAAIIDVRRNPMDCGLSLFKQYFHSGVNFSYQLSDIASAINSYNKIMEHWHNMLPGRIITVQYENLVLSPGTQIINLLDKLGLSYDERCLHFHQNRRDVHTASSEQVRQPLHHNGIDVWRKVDHFLGELKDNLVFSENTS